MIQRVRLLVVLAPMLLAAPVLAQPGAAPGPASDEPPPINAGTVIIVTPQQPVVQPGVAPAAPTGAPGQPMTVTVAPQNEAWDNVSHINGSVVKIGERGDYLYNNWKTTNIASNPIGWIFGFWGLSVSHAVHENVAIRGDANVINFEGSSSHEFGISAPIYFRRVFQGPFIEGGVVARATDGNSDGEHVGPEVLFGWHWMFDSGMNVAMAFGGMRNMNSHTERNAAEPAGYFPDRLRLLANQLRDAPLSRPARCGPRWHTRRGARRRSVALLSPAHG